MHTQSQYSNFSYKGKHSVFLCLFLFVISSTMIDNSVEILQTKG